MDIEKKRSERYERAIREIRALADDKNLRKEQKLQMIRNVLKELEADMWKLKTVEERR